MATLAAPRPHRDPDPSDQADGRDLTQLPMVVRPQMQTQPRRHGGVAQKTSTRWLTHHAAKPSGQVGLLGRPLAHQDTHRYCEVVISPLTIPVDSPWTAADQLDDFNRLDALRRELLQARSTQPPALQVFFDEVSGGFRSTLEKPAGHLSPSSTATCITSLVQAGQWDSGPWASRRRELVATLINDEALTTSGLTRLNAYTTAFLLEAVHALQSAYPDDEIDPTWELNLHVMRHRLLETIASGSVSIAEYPPSGYLTQLTLRIIRRTISLEPSLLERVNDWAWGELCRQIALASAGSKTVDFFQLAYCVLILVSIDNPSNALPEQRLLLDAGLDLFFRAQLEDGSWPRSAPIFDIPGKGNSFCYEYELLTQLLSEPRLQERLLPYLTNFGRAYRALRRTSYDLTDRARGWASGHRAKQGPESWSTASCYSFIFLYERLIAESLRRTVFSYLRAPYLPPTKPFHSLEDFAPNLLDSPLGSRGKLKEIIFRSFVEPIATQVSAVREGRQMKKGTATTAVLFGPPGTSKTQLAHLIAEYLGWPLLSVDPSDFARDGIGSIGMEAGHLFDMIAALESVVVLVDEIDELVRAREHESDSTSRFLTTTLLPKLATINASRRLAFIVATNHIESFDLAISRPGRFDTILQVMPPFATEKIKHWSVLSEALGEGGDRARRQQLQTELDALTYSEAEQLARRIQVAEDQRDGPVLLDNLYQGCTLGASTGGGTTWIEVCHDQTRYIRIPEPILS